MRETKFKLYLSHPFRSRKRLRKWELGFEERTGVPLINPFYEIIGNNSSERCRNIGVVSRDISQIIKSKGVLTIVDGSLSYGTIQEMVYSKLNDRPVYSVITNGSHDHPWLKYHSNKIFRCLGDFENWFTRDCPYCKEDKMHVININKKLKTEMFECGCGKTWLERTK